MKIAGKELRPGREAFIVAEIGINHGGSVSRAIEIIDQLHASGASFDAVKLQYYRTEALCSSAVPVETRATLKRCELSWDKCATVLQYAKAAGYAAVVSVFTVDDIGEMRGTKNVDAWKVASPDAVDMSLISNVGSPIVVSVGGCSDAEVHEVVTRLQRERPNNHAILECVSAYPAGPTFGTITHLSLKYPGTVVGFSDHTSHPCAGELAASAGARIIEHHVVHADEIGIDSAVSLTPDGFASYCRDIREKATISGGEKRVWDCEIPVIRSARKSIVTRCEIKAGERIDSRWLTAKRPGTGIPVSAGIYAVAGKIAARDIPADVPVTWDDIQPSTTTAGPNS